MYRYGSITLIDWGADKLQLAPKEAQLRRNFVMNGAVCLVSAHEEVNVGVQKFKDRLVPLVGAVTAAQRVY